MFCCSFALKHQNRAITNAYSNCLDLPEIKAGLQPILIHLYTFVGISTFKLSQATKLNSYFINVSRIPRDTLELVREYICRIALEHYYYGNF